MRSTVVLTGALLAGLAVLPGVARAQSSGADVCFLRGATPAEAAERPSPLRTTTITMGGQTATLCYGAPSARDRTVMGELVPYGEPWRTGANEATAIHLPFAASLGEVDLEPGSYSIYTIPSEGEWQVVVNRSVERWGIPISADVRGADVGSFTVTPTRAPEFTETLDISWAPHGEGMGHLILQWENTRIEIPVHQAGVARHDHG